jgi:ABC-2 type transport system permease protein
MTVMARPDQRVPRYGWLVVARKELGDHLLSARFLVLVLVLGLAAIVPLYFAADRIRDVASDVSGQPAVFLFLFTIPAEGIAILRVDIFVGIIAPLLGIAFAFDAVNGERADGTLPRLLSQPIHRDDVINGKFAAGLLVIAMVLTAVILLIAAAGMFRLGIVPTAGEILRIFAWLAVTIVYVGFWLAFGLLLSVLVRRAATAALIGFGIWILVTVFGQLIVGLVATFIAPLSGGTQEDQLEAFQTRQTIVRLLPHSLYQESTSYILDPLDPVTAAQQGTRNFIPSSIGQLDQATDPNRIPSLLSVDQSLLLVWPQVVALVFLTVVCFALAYIAFMRQEVRA